MKSKTKSKEVDSVELGKQALARLKTKNCNVKTVNNP